MAGDFSPDQFLDLAHTSHASLFEDGPVWNALAKIKHNPPRLVLLDINMPGMNGVEVLRQMRANHYAGGVIVMTASQDEPLLQQALDLGSVDVMGKPLDLERLLLVVEAGLILTEP